MDRLVLFSVGEDLSMAKRIYVGNLSFSVTSEDLQQLFETYGPVKSAQVMIDRETGRSRGFGFVEMVSDHDADVAISLVDGSEHYNRRLNVNEAKPPVPGGGRRDQGSPGRRDSSGSSFRGGY